MTAAAELIRGTVNNRSIARCWVRQWRIGAAADGTASEPFFFLTRVAARTVASPKPHRRRSAECAEAHRAGPGAATCSRRDGWSGKSGLEALPARSPEDPIFYADEPGADPGSARW